MATSWPVLLDTIYGGAQDFCDVVAALTDGRFLIVPHEAAAPIPGPGGVEIPGLDVMKAVRDGIVPIGHTAAYYNLDLSPILAFPTAVPFGLTTRQQYAWLFDGGGMELLRGYYAEKWGILPFTAGSTGTQMGGWYNKEIKSVGALEGLRMRIGGLGAKILQTLGVVTVSTPGGEIAAALASGEIDAAEWIGPYDDERLLLHEAARYYYYPGWWEPGSTLEVQVNLDAWNELPASYQEAIGTAAHYASMMMLARYDARNHAALQRLLAYGTELRSFDPKILDAAYCATQDVMSDFVSTDVDFADVYAQWSAFRNGVQSWHNTNELAFLDYLADPARCR